MQASLGPSLEPFLVRIYDPDETIVGAGSLVGKRQVLTCAHVVNEALGRSGKPALKDRIKLDFPLIAPGTILTAKVVLWDDSDDIAGLELVGEPPLGIDIAPFASARNIWQHPFCALGFPVTGDDGGVWATGLILGWQAKKWVMIEHEREQGFAVSAGFSGTPVWDTKVHGVVGMVVAFSASISTRTAFFIPTDVLIKAWPIITITVHNSFKVLAAKVLTAIALILYLLLGIHGDALWSSPLPPSSNTTLVTNLLDDGVGSLRWAVANADPKSTIIFANGLEGQITLKHGDLEITRDLTIQGPGKDVLMISNDNLNNNVLSISSHVSASISGLAFKYSYVAIEADKSFITNNGILTLTDIRVSDNRGDTLTESIKNNGTLLLTNSIVSDNDGGGIYNDFDGSIQIKNSTISGNTTYGQGGGIYNSGNAWIINSTISGNRSIYIQGQPSPGGGVYNNGTLTIINSTISDNQATGIGKNSSSGGGIYNTQGTLTITNSTIVDNLSSDDGGGIANDNVSSDNSGGIINNQVSKVDITACLIYHNKASNGGGIANSGQLFMRNTIVATNQAKKATDISGILTSNGYNLIQNNSGMLFQDGHASKSDIIGASPMIGSLQNNSVAPPTYPLLSGSPAIDKIPSGLCHSQQTILDDNGNATDQYSITTDQNSNLRPDSNEGTCDIGPYESSY